MVGGIIGGVIVGVVLLVLGYWWLGTSEFETLRTKVADLEGAVASSGSGEVGELEGRISALESAASGDLVSRLEAIEAKAEDQGSTEARLAALESGAQTPDLTGRIEQIETALQQLPSEAAPQLAGLEQRLAALETSAAAQPSDGSGAADGEALSALQDQLNTVASNLSSIGDRVQSMEQQLASLQQAETKLDSLSGNVDQLSQQVSAISDRVAGAETKIEDAERNRNRATSLALLVGQLEAAIEGAQPYQTQVEALSAMSGGDSADDQAIKQAVGELEPGAAAGVPSVADLKQSFDAIANDIVHAARAVDNDNLLDRATDNLMRLVTVRPVGGDVRGDTVEARVARAEAALDQGNLAAAVSEVEQLEGRPAEVAAPWLERAKMRLGADQAVAQLRGQAADLLRQNP